MTRLYGRKGFTTRKAVRHLLEPYELPTRARARRVRIERLPAQVAAALLEQLPAAQRDDRARLGSPSFGDLVELGLAIPGAVLCGYRVVPDDRTERVTITQLVIPNEEVDHEKVARLASGLSDPSVIVVGSDGSVAARWAQ